MTPSKVLFFLCISFVAGIFLESVIKIQELFVLGILFLGIIFIFSSLFYKRISFVIGFCILFLVIGILRVQISEFNIASDKLSKLNGKGQVVLTGTIYDEPDVRDTSQKIKVKISNSTVLVTTDKYPEYKYLDQVKLTGKLETPASFDDFNYKNYLLPDHIYSVMSYPKIALVSVKHKYDIYSYIYEKILFLKQGLRQSIENNFLPPQSYILRGIILGEKSSMPSDLKNEFSTAGLSYIIAISGMHVVILSAILMSVLLALGLWRGQAFYFSAFFITIYIVLTGMTTSGIRAGIMGFAYLLAQKLGRQNFSSRSVVLAAVVMLLINPLLLIYDVGFQLSFLAVLGIIYLEPIVRNFINIIFKDKLKVVTSILSMSISAQIFTMPIMIFNFGSISLVALITSFLILPILPWIMSFGFLSSLAGIVWSALGWILSVPCYFLLLYFMQVINFFSQPWMAKTITNVSWIWFFAAYFIIALGTWFLNKKYIQKIV